MTFRSLYETGKHHFATVCFLFGFIFDSLTLPDPSEPLAKYIGIVYLSILALLLLLREYIVSRNTASKIEQKLYSYVTIGIALISGAVLSIIFVYYFRSAELGVSWPLFLLFVIVILVNEFVSFHTFRFILDLCVLMVSLIFFAVFNIPLFIGEQNDTVFIISVIFATCISFIFLHLLSYTSEQAKIFTHKAYAVAVAVSLIVMVLYFSNLIPAVPLTLKNADVYHDITRTNNGEYTAVTEKDAKGILSYFNTETFHYIEGETIYFFSSVSAPNALQAPLSHVWEYYDAVSKKWIESTIISFPLTGGREDGYRAYSKKENIFPGLWRVSVRVGDRRFVGRKKFIIEKVLEPVVKNYIKI